MYLQGQDGLAELTVDDLANSGVNGAQAADDAFDAGDDAQNVTAGEFLNGQNKEQDGQGQEYSLGSSVVLEGADDLAAAAEMLLNNPALCREVGIAARHFVCTHYDWSVVFKAFGQLDL